MKLDEFFMHFLLNKQYTTLSIKISIWILFSEWSRQALLDAWMKDPVACCKESGITPPSSALNFSPTQDTLKTCCEQIQNEYQSETLNSPSKTPLVKEELTVIFNCACIFSFWFYLLVYCFLFLSKNLVIIKFLFLKFSLVLLCCHFN